MRRRPVYASRAAFPDGAWGIGAGVSAPIPRSRDDSTGAPRSVAARALGEGAPESAPAVLQAWPRAPRLQRDLRDEPRAPVSAMLSRAAAAPAARTSTPAGGSLRGVWTIVRAGRRPRPDPGAVPGVLRAASSGAAAYETSCKTIRKKRQIATSLM